jgi:hypothetical protein
MHRCRTRTAAGARRGGQRQVSAHPPIFAVGVSAQSSVSGDGGIPELPFPDLPTPDYTEEEKLPPRPAAPPAPEPDNPLPELPPNHPKEVMHSGMRR